MQTAFRTASFKVCGAIGLMFLATLVYAEEHQHEHGARSAQHSLNQGKKWATDEVLRQEMDTILQVMTANREGIENKRLAAQDYQRLAVAVDKSVANIVNSCKLTKESDAAFHGIVLADLAQGTELMRTSTNIQAQRVGALGVLQALRNYGQYFQHPGWTSGVAKMR